MSQPNLNEKAAATIEDLKHMARLHRTNGDTAAAEEFDDFGVVVRELVAENERLVAQLCVCPSCHGQGDVYTGENTWEGHFQPPEPIMEKCGECDGDGVIGDADDLKSLLDERDQLKGEIESLHKRIDDMSPLKGAPLLGPDAKCLACGGYHYGMGGLPCPNMRITAQADLPETRSGQIGGAMSKGEQP